MHPKGPYHIHYPDWENFATLGRWLGEADRPAVAVLEGGFSEELPLLIDAFLSAWETVVLHNA